MVNEVRYIYPPMSKTPRGVEHDRSDRWENQEPIKNGEKIRVFHATDLKTAIRIAKEGLSGEERVPRNFSYEAGMNPAGLFVSTNFDVVKDFGFQGNNQVILEFTADTNDLDTPVWNNQGTYFGQGSNPQPFRNRDERTLQRQVYDDEARKSEYDYITKSDNPALAEKIFTNNEHQALFFGDLNPNMIKRWWVKDIYHYDKDWNRTQEDWTAKFVPMTLTQFLRKYGKFTYQERNYKGEYDNKPVQKTKLFKPNEDFSIEEFARREAMDKDGNVNQEDYNSTLEYLKDNIQRWRSGDFGWGDAAMLKELLFPKQLVQMLGTENYRENFNSMFPQQYGKETKYGNNQYNNNNMKGNDRISLTESEFNKIVRNVSRKIIKETFDTNRGQYMAGRVHARRMANPSKYTGQLFYAADHANDMAGGKWSDPFDRGYELEKDPLASNRTRRDAYHAFKDADMNQLGSKFIRFIESNDGGSMLQDIVDYESGNQTGEPCSPLPAIIPEFETAMGIKCTPEMKQAIKKAYNNWWYYAQETLMPEEDGTLNENTKKSKKVRITENTLRKIVRESIKKTLKQTKD